MWRKSRGRRSSLAAVGAVSLVLAVSGEGAGTVAAHAPAGHVFGVDSAKITNRYLPITKFHRTVLAGNDQGQHLRIVRVLKDRTKRFTYRGRTVKTAVVVDRVTDVGAGQLIERTVDYFAQDRAGNV